MKTMLLVGVALFVLGACACENKTPAPVTDATATPAQGIAVGEPNPAAPAAEAQPADPAAPPVDGEAKLTAPATAIAGASVTVGWTGPGNGGDYIDLVPRGYSDVRGEITYAYVRNSNGSVIVRAPTAAGDYDLRYVIDLSGKRSVKAISPLAVSAAVATLVVVAAATTGQALEVSWTGPNGPGDYIDITKKGETETSGEITYAYTGAGSPAKLEAPSAAGAYDIRYVLDGPGGRKVPATTPLTVTAARATLDAPASAAKGAKVKVVWTGPKSSGDYVDLVRKGETKTSGELSYFYTDNAAAELTAPNEAGEYEIRYVLDAPGGRAVLARRAISIR